jgi:hypothetical protein
MREGSRADGAQGRSARPRRRLELLAVALVALVALAWLVEWRAAGGVSTPGAVAGTDAAGPPGYTVAVLRGGDVLRRFTPADLRRLPQVTITADGKEQDGPTVHAVLSAAGVTDFDRLEVRGMGLRDDGRLTLAARQVGEDLVLDFTDRGTLKVVSPDLDWGDRVRDVTELRVGVH